MMEMLSAAVREGATVVTANKRLARDLRRQFDLEQQGGGRRAWAAPKILPWAAWTEWVWMEAVLSGAAPRATRLSIEQSEALWRNIIESSDGHRLILQTRQAAASAMSAWKLIQQNLIPWKKFLFHGHDDWNAFTGWAVAFEKRLAANEWIDETQVIDQLTPAVGSGKVPLPKRLLLGGFDELTPQQSRFLEALRSAGCPCDFLIPPGTGKQISRVELLDCATEFRAAAQWAKARLLKNGGARIGVVIPLLNSRRSLAERIFTEVFHPDWILGLTRGRAQFHISAGRPLDSWPVVYAAFQALGLTRPVISMHEAGAVVRSPYLAGNSVEMCARAKADAKLRRHRPNEVRTSEIDFWGVGRIPLPSEQRPSEWTRTFRSILEISGWPGDVPADSIEFQGIRAWDNLLQKFESLDPMLPLLDVEAAITRLRELAAASDFQPEDPGAPVQITGALEAAGAGFDHLWIANLDDESWPQAAHPHPFLPPSLQTEYSLPHCSPEREYEFAARTTQRLLQSAPDIVLSHSRTDGERTLRPSTLIRHVPPAGIVLEDDDYSRLLRTRGTLESVSDHYATPLPEGAAKGGARILKDQAQCPFRAFASFRLMARPLEAGSLGVDPAEHGIALHRALELFWAQVPSQQALAGMNGGELRELVRKCAMEAVQGLKRVPAGTLDRRFRQLEVDRVEWVLAEWLKVERERAPFEVVHREKQKEIHVGGMDLMTRIDRADRLASGELVILDYKSTAPSTKAWEGDRPDEPQLPLYSTAMTGEALGGVAFAQLTPGDLKFKGVSDRAVLPDVRPLKNGESLAGRIADWSRVLGVLAREFRDGYAAVTPKKEACAFCGLDALCRIHEHRVATEGTPDV
jgi:hypothetical protein